MAQIADFRDLVVWQRSVDLAVEVYMLTRHFPPDERFGLTAQARRAGISVSSNIAEGSGRQTAKDRLDFLTMSRGSTKEVESLLLVSQRLGFASPVDCAKALGFADEVGRMLTRMRQTLRQR